MYAVEYEVSHHPSFSLIEVHSIGCKHKLINFNRYNLRIYIQDPHFLWPRIVFYPLYVRRNFMVCPHKPMLKLGVPWLKKRLRNTG
jgi:hypothetical protein